MTASGERGAAPLIAIEGTDGSGKSTATRLLVELLRGRGIEVATYDFPVYDEPRFGPLLSRFLRGGFEPIGPAEPWFVAMLFAGNRAETSSRIRADMAAGRLVVCDRFSYSNIAYQSAKLPAGEDVDAFAAWLDHLELETFATPRPDASFWLRVPLELRPAATARRGDRAYLAGEDDVHEADAPLQQRVHQAYERLAATHDDIETIDCAPGGSLLPPAEVAAALLARLRSLELVPERTSAA